MEKMTERVNRQGGHRPGSGRKPTGRKKIYHNITISGSPEEIERIDDLVKGSGKTRSRYVIEALLENQDRQEQGGE